MPTLPSAIPRIPCSSCRDIALHSLPPLPSRPALAQRGCCYHRPVTRINAHAPVTLYACMRMPYYIIKPWTLSCACMRMHPRPAGFVLATTYRYISIHVSTGLSHPFSLTRTRTRTHTHTLPLFLSLAATWFLSRSPFPSEGRRQAAASSDANCIAWLYPWGCHRIRRQCPRARPCRGAALLPP